ncbi:MAG: hypothetical protein MJZ79_08265 [Paludibacteraceae bacterium]|nr:hypothetical protein [Paludibacteraceae bacterium]
MKKSIFSMALMAMTIAFVGCKSDEPSNGSQDGGDYQLDSVIDYTIDGTKEYKTILDYNYGNDQLILTRYDYVWENYQWIENGKSVITCTGKITNMTQGCYNFLSRYPDELKETIGWSKVSFIRYDSYYDGDWRKKDDDEDTYTIDANGFLTEIDYQSYPSYLVDSKRKEVFTSNSQGQPISSEYYKFEGDWKIWSKSKYTYNNDGKLTMIMNAEWDYEKEDLGEFRKSVEISYNGNQIELISIDNLWEKSGKYMYTYDGYGNISNVKWYSGSPQHEGEWELEGINQYYYSKVK